MLNIGGELAFILSDNDYTSKQDLLKKLRDLRQCTQYYTKEEKQLLKPFLAVAIQQAFYASDYELKKYKNYIKWRDKQNGR